MQLAESKDIEIKLLHQEPVKGPFSKSVGTGSSAARMFFFLTLRDSERTSSSQKFPPPAPAPLKK